MERLMQGAKIGIQAGSLDGTQYAVGEHGIDKESMALTGSRGGRRLRSVKMNSPLSNRPNTEK